MVFGIYPDTILFFVGGLFALSTIIFFTYLLVSRRRSLIYTEVLRQETEVFDAITVTLSQTTQNSTFALSTAYSNSQFGSYEATEGLHHQGATLSTSPNAAGDSGTVAVWNDSSIGAQWSPRSASDAEYAFNPNVIADSYDIVSEVGGGAMSRTFVVRSKKLGNLWFLKFVSRKDGRLMGEENILKLLNHMSLPRIIDVYHRSEGVYLIVTLIEGVALNKLCDKRMKLGQYVLTDWFEQIAQTLNYLHTMQPTPLLHLDLKPGNIMITHDNRLMLVDFGISRRFGEGASGAVTAAYAAPEQFGGRTPSKLERHFNTRFGIDPAYSASWQVDARTDLYSLGVIMFELATGQAPVQENLKILQNHVSSELCAIILKCLAVNPRSRYQSAAQLLEDLRKTRGSNIKMARAIVMRKIAKVAVFFTLLASAASFVVGYNVYAVENGATLSSEPDIVTVSLHQSTAFTIERTMPNGRVIHLDNAQIRWEASAEGVAQIDGGRVVGLNTGETVFTGNHRNGEVSLHVRVVEPIDGLIEISQRFRVGRYVSVFAGTTDRDRVDGSLASMNFFSPESIVSAEDGTIYFTDAGILRTIRNGVAETIQIYPNYIRADMVRLSGDDVYILSSPWQDDNDYFFAIAPIRNGQAQKWLTMDARRTAIKDFAFSDDGTMYYIEHNAGLGIVLLNSFDFLRNFSSIARLPQGSSSLALSPDGTIFIGNADEGVIYVLHDGELRYFAGIAGERGFIDGSSPRFYMPQRLEYRAGYLYVWDFNTLRRIEVRGAVAVDTISIAGIASPVYDREIGGTSFAAENIVLPHGRMMDFTVTDEGVILTDHKRGVMWVVCDN